MDSNIPSQHSLHSTARDSSITNSTSEDLIGDQATKISQQSQVETDSAKEIQNLIQAFNQDQVRNKLPENFDILLSNLTKESNTSQAVNQHHRKYISDSPTQTGR